LPDADKHCDCGVQMNRIGSETSEQLSVIPPQWYVIRHLRHKYACPNGCIETAPMPAQPIAASQASPQLLAHTIVSKFHDGLPLYRQTKIAARQGVDLASSKLARWLIQLLPLFQPLFNLLQETLVSYDITQIDATGLQVLDEPGRRAEAKSYFGYAGAVRPTGRWYWSTMNRPKVALPSGACSIKPRATWFAMRPRSSIYPSSAAI
jgi:transposase